MNRRCFLKVALSGLASTMLPAPAKACTKAPPYFIKWTTHAYGIRVGSIETSMGILRVIKHPLLGNVAYERA